jgi:hypothetical protein
MEVGALDGAREAFDTVLRAAPENLVALRGLAEVRRRRQITALERVLASVQGQRHSRSAAANL